MADEKEETIVADDEAEETIEEDKTSDEKNEEESGDKSEDKLTKSEIAQKIKYREKYQAESAKTQRLEAELNDLKGMIKKPAVGDDAEARAQAYIRDQAKAVFEELQSARKADEDKITKQFEDKVEMLLDDNPDISEEELLDAIEEYEVEPEIALKILKKSTTTKPKPKMPQSRRASATEAAEKVDDSKKTMWQILQEESRKFKK